MNPEDYGIPIVKRSREELLKDYGGSRMVFTGRMKATYSTLVTVEADSLADAIEKFKSGDWIDSVPDELVDWNDRPSQVRSEDE